MEFIKEFWHLWVKEPLYIRKQRLDNPDKKINNNGIRDAKRKFLKEYEIWGMPFKSATDTLSEIETQNSEIEKQKKSETEIKVEMGKQQKQQKELESLIFAQNKKVKELEEMAKNIKEKK